MIADLNAEYTARVGIARNASIVDTLTMLPPSPCSSNTGSTARVHVSTCARFTRYSSSHSSSRCSWKALRGAAVVTDVVDQHVDAPEVVACGRHERGGRVALTHVAYDGDRPLAHRYLRLAGAGLVDLREHDRGALGDETLDDPAPDAAAATRDDRDLAVEQLRHARAATRASSCWRTSRGRPGKCTMYGRASPSSGMLFQVRSRNPTCRIHRDGTIRRVDPTRRYPST